MKPCLLTRKRSTPVSRFLISGEFSLRLSIRWRRWLVTALTFLAVLSAADTMAAEMALRREISHARGHKRKVRAEEEEDTPEGLRHLKKAEPQFKWKKERKR